MKEPIEPEDIDEIDDDEELEDDEDVEDLSVAEKVIGVFIAPKSTFKYLAERPDFWSAFIIISLILIALGMLTMKNLMPMMLTQTIEQTQEKLASSGMSEQDMATTINQLQKYMPYFFYGQAVIGTPIGLVVAWLLLTVAVFFIGLMQGLKTDFKNLFGILPWLSLISMVPAKIIASVIIFSGKITSIADMTNMRVMAPVSILGIIPQNVALPKIVEGMLSTIDPFYIWSMIVMVFALEYVNKCKRSQAITTTVIIAILGILLSGLFTGMAGMSQVSVG
ncbi:MAG: YIP1 family protein [bacterium]|nr:YIP1 family protein [bacterium]